MSDFNCESVQMAAMAIADGHATELTPEQVEMHLAGCSECRQEVEQLGALSAVLDAQVRRQSTESVWPQVEKRILGRELPSRAAARGWRPFLILGVFLLVYRMIEMIPDRHFGLLFKLIPILFVIAAFGYLKENPFKIETNLRLEGE